MVSTTTPAPVDTISVDPSVTFADGIFTITGHVASSVGVQSVTVSGWDRNLAPHQGLSTIDGNGNFSYSFAIGKESFENVSATETDNAGQKKTVQANFGLDSEVGQAPFVAIQESFTSENQRTSTDYFRNDGSVQKSIIYGHLSQLEYTITNNNNDNNTIDVSNSNLAISTQFRDTINNGERPDNTFVFEPGYEVDIVKQFLVDGPDHDTLSLPSSDFTSIADVLRHTYRGTGGAVIHDPVSGDTIRLPGVSKAELVHNRGDFVFHG